MTARLVRGGIALATMGGAMALGFASPASAADTGIPVLEKIKQCESGGDYQAENPTSTASGAYQFIDGTFQSLDASQGYSHAADAPESVQDAAALELYNEQGTGPWAPSASCWQAAGATAPAVETNTDGADAGVYVAPESESSSAGTPAPQAPVDQTPAQAQFPLEETPVAQTPAEPEFPVEQAPVNQAPVEDAPAEDAPVNQVPAEQAPVDEAQVEDAPIDQAPVEQAPVAHAPVDQAPVDDAEQDFAAQGGTQVGGAAVGAAASGQGC